MVDQNSGIDYITFSGSGEPTLNSDIGEIIRQIKAFSQTAVAVLTNGSMLWKKEVRDDLAQADLVVPSVDAVSEEVFQRINRPAEELNLETILKGIQEFCEGFKGKIYAEIMLVKGVNDSREEINRINDFVKHLRADRIQINTVIRPPGDPSAKALDEKELLKIKECFDPSLPVEVIAEFDRRTSRAYQEDLEKAIIEMLRRRPTRRSEMATALGVHLNEVVKYLDILEKKGDIRRSKSKSEGENFYLIN